MTIIAFAAVFVAAFLSGVITTVAVAARMDYDDRVKKIITGKPAASNQPSSTSSSILDY